MKLPIQDPQFWLLISPYLDQALDLPREGVAQWLAELERNEPQIAPVIRELLVQRDRLDAAGFLTVPLIDDRTMCRALIEVLKGG